MTGTGDPNNTDAESAVDINSNEVPQNGNTFSGMIVNENIKQQIEAGSASHFLECHKRDDGLYDLMPTLPEEGCDGPERPVYKLRENHNRLMKGIARKFVNTEGNIDAEAGKKFILEMSDRFSLGEGVPNSDIYNNPYGNNVGDGFQKYSDIIEVDGNMKNDFKANVEWLCNELEIPEQERADFGNYCTGNLGQGLGPFGTGKVLSGGGFMAVFTGYAEKFEMARNMSEDMKLYEQKQQDPNIKNPVPIEKYKELMDNYKALTQELNGTGNRLVKLAGMDPKDHKLVNVVDCDLNSQLVLSYMAQAKQADEVLERKSKIGNLAGYVLDFHFKNDKQTNQRLDTKWPVHYAPVIGTVEQDGHTYDLTLETIAVATNKLAKEPPIAKPSIGLYKGKADAQAAYEKNVYMTQEENKLAEQILSYNKDKWVYNARRNDEITQKAKCALQLEYTEQFNRFHQTATNKQLDKSQPFLQQSREIDSLIPEYLKDKYEEISSAFAASYRKNQQIEKCYQVNKKMKMPPMESKTDKRSMEAYKRMITEDIAQKRNESTKELSSITKAMRYVVGDIKQTDLTNEMKKQNPQDSTAISGIMKKHGIKMEELTAFRKIVKQREAVEAANLWIREGKQIINANFNQETKKIALANLISAQTCLENGIIKNQRVDDNTKIISSKKMTDTMADQSEKILKSTAFQTLLENHHGDLQAMSSISPHLLATEYANIRLLEKVRQKNQQPVQQQGQANLIRDNNRSLNNGR